MKKPAKYLIVIAGPTGVGKSALAIELAEWLSTEVLSADSRQIYREMSIGTAKPSPSELDRVKHHFVDELSIREPFSAARFEEEGLNRLETLFRTKPVAILCGGTGLYINALSQGLDRIPDVDPAVRDAFEDLFKKEGIEFLQQQLKSKDPEYANIVDLHNHRRLIRALTVIETTGKPFSGFLKTAPAQRPFECINILLSDERKILYERIDQRVDQMIASGLEKEVKNLLPYRDLAALQTVGYQEWFPYLEGMYDKPEAIRLIKRNSRHYAKRQMTWFRKYGTWETFLYHDREAIKAFIESRIDYY